MFFATSADLERALTGIVEVGAGTLRIADAAALRSSLTDRLAYDAVFNRNETLRDEVRALLRALACEAGAVPSSIHELYMARGRGEVRGFTVPAVNIRILTYDVARALFRAALANDCGAMIFEIAKSEIGYTEQRPAEYASCVLAAAIREGYQGPVFIQGDHFQFNAKKWAKDPDAEISSIEKLIDEAIPAGFLNIDIDASTLVDLGRATVSEQQETNSELGARFTKYIREREPGGVTISVGGEIGEVGMKNSTPEELRAYMDGYVKALPAGMATMSKVSVQSGTSHGGVVLPDGSVAQVKLDFETLGLLSAIARDEYKLSGAVQHGASTLPDELFDRFPRVETSEIHLATGFQNAVYEHPLFPSDFRESIYAWCDKNCTDERKAKDSAEQFHYKSRKKAIGPHKQQFWDLAPEVREGIGRDLEAKFDFLIKKLGVAGSREMVECTTPRTTTKTS